METVIEAIGMTISSLAGFFPPARTDPSSRIDIDAPSRLSAPAGAAATTRNRLRTQARRDTPRRPPVPRVSSVAIRFEFAICAASRRPSFRVLFARDLEERFEGTVRVGHLGVDPRLFDVVEERDQAVEVLLGDRVELVVVAAGAARR